LNKACTNRWRKARLISPREIPKQMKPMCLRVLRAMSFFMSSSKSAFIPLNKMVNRLIIDKNERSFWLFRSME